MKNIKIFLLILLISILISSALFAQNNSVYRVKRGDTLLKIADYFNVPLASLQEVNRIKNPDFITIGQKLTIPADSMEYVIKKGDTLKKIADRFGVNLTELIKINQIKNPNFIICGRKLIIPEKMRKARTNTVSRSIQINFIWPVQGRISSPFGRRVDPVTGRSEYHSGIDIAVPIGSPVYAAEDGVVICSENKGGYGKLVIIKHRNNYTTYYGHNIELIVKEGEYVEQGRIIALSGSSGNQLVLILILKSEGMEELLIL